MPKTREFFDFDVEEISLVDEGADPAADVLIYMAADGGPEELEGKDGALETPEEQADDEDEDDEDVPEEPDAPEEPEEPEEPEAPSDDEDEDEDGLRLKLAQLQSEVDSLKNERKLSELAEEAARFSIPGASASEVAQALGWVAERPAEAVVLRRVLTAVTAVVEKSELFSDIGHRSGHGTGEPADYAELKAQAAALAASGEYPSEERAISALLDKYPALRR